MPDNLIPRDESSFMSYRGQAVYISTFTRPDLTFAVNQLPQTKPSETNDPDFKRLKENSYELMYGNVNFEIADIQVFSDASFTNNKDLSS